MLKPFCNSVRHKLRALLSSKDLASAASRAQNALCYVPVCIVSRTAGPSYASGPRQRVGRDPSTRGLLAGYMLACQVQHLAACELSQIEMRPIFLVVFCLALAPAASLLATFSGSCFLGRSPVTGQWALRELEIVLYYTTPTHIAILQFTKEGG